MQTITTTDNGAASISKINSNFIAADTLGGTVVNYSDYASLQAAINDAATTKCNVWLPYNTVVPIPSTLYLMNNVRIIGNGSTLQWTGSAGSPMISNYTTGSLLFQSGMENIFLDTNTSNQPNVILDLHSPLECKFKDITYLNGSATLTVLQIRCDVAVLNWESNCNAAYNIFDNITGYYGTYAATCGYGVVLQGTASPYGFITLNEFKDFEFPDCRVMGYSLVQWCDDNVFTGVHRVELNANNAVGITFNSSSTPSVDVGVYNNPFSLFAPDIFGAYTGRLGVVINNCQSVIIENLFWTSSSWAYNTILVNNYAQNYWVKCVGYSNGVIGILTKGVDFDQGFGIGTGPWAGCDKAISFTNGTPPSGNPTTGGCLYASAGALYWKGSSGTVTKIANA